MSLRTKIDSGAPDREVKHKAQQRAREAALRAALVKLEGEPVVIKGATATPAPAVVEHPHSDLSTEERSAVLTRQSVPVTVREIGVKEKSWMRGGIQFRPMTRREREEEENAKFDKQMTENYAKYCELVQMDLDLSAGYEKARLARESRERRTGLRPLPSSKDRTISLHEAQRLGYIGNSDED